MCTEGSAETGHKCVPSSLLRQVTQCVLSGLLRQVTMCTESSLRQVTQCILSGLPRQVTECVLSGLLRQVPSTKPNACSLTVHKYVHESVPVVHMDNVQGGKDTF